MKLLFPNGEHPQVLLSEGSSQVGSGPGCTISLAAPDIAARHCEIRLAGNAATVRLHEPSARVLINGAMVSGEAPLRPGDLIAFAGVQARVVAVERAAATAPTPRPAQVDDSGATRLRMAVPKFVLRGVSGAAFGKTFAVGKEMIIGRQQDCDIPVPAEEISRHHAKVKPTADGLSVEDMGSANGTFINGKRVQQGLLKPGEELRLDTIRFLLIAPGVEIPKAAAPSQPAADETSGPPWGLIIGGLVIAAVVIAGLVYALR